jgi:hypothetical protein
LVQRRSQRRARVEIAISAENPLGGIGRGSTVQQILPWPAADQYFDSAAPVCARLVARVSRVPRSKARGASPLET